jgi:outer membrane lipoprotein
VLQKPLDATDRTEGCFMALCEGYLDPAVYSKGCQVTLAGRVLGTRTDTVGEITYVYPLLACLVQDHETHCAMGSSSFQSS